MSAMEIVEGYDGDDGFDHIEASDQSLIEQAYGKRASERAAAQWVFDNLASPNPQDPPSVGAVGLLIYARTHQDKFYSQIWPKLMPSRQQIDAASERDTAGEGALDRLLKLAYAEAVAEGN